MNSIQNLHKSYRFINTREELSGTAVSENYTQSLEKKSTLLQKNKENKQPLEVQFKIDKREFQSRLYLVDRENYSNENLDIVKNSGRTIFSINIQKLDYNEDLSKLYQLGYWVQKKLNRTTNTLYKNGGFI